MKVKKLLIKGNPIHKASRVYTGSEERHTWREFNVGTTTMKQALITYSIARTSDLEGIQGTTLPLLQYRVV